MDTATKTRTCQECGDVIAVTGAGTLAPHTREHKLLGEVRCLGSGKTSLPECQVVDQILAWTTPDGALQIRQGDLILDGGKFEQITRIGFTDDVYKDRVAFVLEGVAGVSLAACDALVAVRRYVETTEE